MEAVVSARDVDNIYKVPLYFRAEGVDDFILEHFGIEAAAAATSSSWEELDRGAPTRRAERRCGSRWSASTSSSRTPTCRSSRRCATRASSTAATIEIDWVDSETLDDGEVRARGSPSADGILIPGGFGVRGIEGKITAARIAREQRIPFLGICLGMQMAVAEFARHVVGMDGANSTEFDPETPYPVIDLLPEQKEVADMGGTMRLGADPVKLHDGHAGARDLRRGRHLRAPPPPLRGQQLPAHAGSRPPGLVCSGTSPDERLVEIIELADHPFFVASQYHPEFKSRPERPAPLFRDFVGAGARARARARAERAAATEIRAVRGAAGARPHREARRSDGRAGAAWPSTFAELCRDPRARPGRSAACADARARRAAALGLEVEEDDAAGDRREAGNLLARIAGRGERTDAAVRAPRHGRRRPAPIEPVLVDGGWENAQRRDPRRRQQGRGRGDARGRAALRASRAPPVGLELLFTVAEEIGAARAPRRSTPSRLRADFGYVFDHATPIGEVVVASPTYYRIDADFHGKAAHAGIRPEDGRSAIVAAAHAIAAMPLGRIDDRDDRERRLDHGGVGVDQRRRRALPRCWPRPARSTPTRVEDVRRARSSTRSTTAPRRRECDVDVDHRAAVRRLPPEAVVARGRGRRGGAARLRLRAAAIATGGGSDANALEAAGLPVRQPRQRHRAQPRADRARVASRRSRGCSTSRSRCSTRPRAVRRHELRASSAIGGETIYEGKFFTVRARHASATRTARRSSARSSRHPGAVGVVVLDGDRLWLVRQPREAVGEPGPARAPGGKLDEEGEEPLETAKRELAEEIGKAAEHWEPLGSFYTSPGFTDEEVHLFLATGHLRRRRAPEVEEDERIDVEVRPLVDLDAILAETQGRQDADRAALAARPARRAG